jgi:hypothetical protein
MTPGRFMRHLAAALLPMLAAPAAWAALTFSGSQGTLSASASFEIVGGKLQVVLTNTSANDALVPSDLLSGVYFNLAGGAGQLTPFSATAGGITYLNGAQKDAFSVAGQNVGGEWDYEAISHASLPGLNAGISSSGVGSIWDQPGFGGPNLGGPIVVDGMQYGITSAGDNVATGNNGLLDNEITKNSVIFLLDIANGFSLSSISNVTFQYGTSLEQPRYTAGPPTSGPPGVPAPATLLLVALAAACGWQVRRSRGARASGALAPLMPA